VITIVPQPTRSSVPPANLKTALQELASVLSASRLNCFHTCRLKFYFRYVLKLVKPTSPALFVGKAVHAVLQAWNLARWRGENRAPESFREVLDDAWANPESTDSVAWKGEEETLKESAWALLEAYFRETHIPADEKPQGVEVCVEADLAPQGLPKLLGIIDRVRPGGKVVDFKTSGQTPNPERAVHQHELQLTCYGILYREATGEPAKSFELHHLVKLKTPKIVIVAMDAIRPAQEARLYRAIESYLEGLEREDFVPSPGMACLACEYFNECRAWSGTRQNSAERRMAA
jgi:putative RecB family exonuclease